jgi:hypothetical protein
VEFTSDLSATISLTSEPEPVSVYLYKGAVLATRLQQPTRSVRFDYKTDSDTSYHNETALHVSYSNGPYKRGADAKLMGLDGAMQMA